MYTVYILFSKTRDKFYIGFTGQSLAERVRRHLSNHAGFTGTAPDWTIVWQEKFPDKHTAMKREREIKSWKSRKKIEQLLLTK